MKAINSLSLLFFDIIYISFYIYQNYPNKILKSDILDCKSSSIKIPGSVNENLLKNEEESSTKEWYIKM